MFFQIFSDQKNRAITVKAELDVEIMELYKYCVFLAILCIAL